MAELENLLLEAAGRTNSSARNRRRRRREGSYSDDNGGSDSRDDDDSDDDDRGYGKRKASGPQIPPKKRLDAVDIDEEDEDRSEEEDNADGSDDSDVGSDLYKDDDDRRKLAEMTELQREMILLDRASKKEDKNLKEKLRPNSKGKSFSSINASSSSASVPAKKKDHHNHHNHNRSHNQNQTPPSKSSSSRVRSSARSADRATAKDDALNELRAKRLKQQQDPESHTKLRNNNNNNNSRSSRRRKSYSSSSQSDESDDSQSRSDDDERRMMIDSEDDDEDDRGIPGSEGLTFEDIKEITIRRSKLAKWLMEPFFEELIVGCFVRVGIGRSKSGPIYRLCLVRNVDATEPDRQYKLENKITHKYLNVVWGNENSAARWQMAMVSDSHPIDDEFRQWLREVERSGGRLPTKREVVEKREAIKKINTFVYSAETVKQMLREKKSASARPMNVALEKDRLRRELEVARSRGDEPEMERIKARLGDLEASRKTKNTDAKAVRLSEMNRKNRVENFKNASELKPVNTGLKAGEAGYDPFSRRWTRSRNYYVSKPGEPKPVEPKPVGLEATAAALEAAAGAGKLVDTLAPVDQGTIINVLHNFELPISLIPLQKFGGPMGAQAGFMARKQRIEATVGCQVPENDGRRHALTLSVSDYKRRRGLL